MTSLESIVKLRESLHDCTTKAGVEPNRFDTYWITARACDILIDDIEREIAEKYMLLPVDADGVPIKPGDCVRGLEGENADARFVTIHCDGTYNVGSRGWQPHYLRHVKPRTVEDVLNDFAKRVLNSGHQWGLDAEETTAEYANELRELLGGDGE